MKYILFLSLLISLNVGAALKITVDPTLNSQIMLECSDPIAREDESLLQPGEIADRVFFVKENNSWIRIGNNTVECSQIITVTGIVDGTYLYTVTAIDQQKRESRFSMSPDLPDGAFEVTVKRLPPPKAPSSNRVRLLP